MALILEIEHLSGVCFASLGPDSEAPDWPIQPDRVFSALVAAWAARGGDPRERAALTWLEAQAPPLIDAVDAAPRTAPSVFVPPNDPRARLTKNIETILGAHGRQPRRFPAVAALDRAGGLITRMIWSDVAAAEAPLHALDAIARDAAYIGHSTSLTRCRFLMGKAEAGARVARRWVYPGRMNRLEQDFIAHRRPSPGEPVLAKPSRSEPVRPFFSGDWLVLAIEEPEPGHRTFNPDLRAAPQLAKLIRDVLMTGYRDIGLTPPALISGHTLEGAPTADPHLAILPLANVGYAHSDAALHGFALAPPRGVNLLEVSDFKRALAAVAPYDKETRSRRLTLAGARLSAAVGDGERLVLRFGGDGAALRSLDPARYMGPASTWATATPMVLERHLKAESPHDRQGEVEALIARACAHIGLPKPAQFES